jgi:phage-related protein
MRKIAFEGDTRQFIKSMPEAARRRAGYDHDLVQRDREPLNWKPFASVGQGVREIRIRVEGQYRIIYVAKFTDRVYVLHAFQKKTQKTRSADIELARQRYREIAMRVGA